MLYFSLVVLYVPRIEDNLETWLVEIWVMNATPNGTLFGIVGSWVVDLLQLEQPLQVTYRVTASIQGLSLGS